MFYKARDLEDFRPYFDYVRGLYLIGLTPWYQLIELGGYTPNRHGGMRLLDRGYTRNASLLYTVIALR